MKERVKIKAPFEFRIKSKKKNYFGWHLWTGEFETLESAIKWFNKFGRDILSNNNILALFGNKKLIRKYNYQKYGRP